MVYGNLDVLYYSYDLYRMIYWIIIFMSRNLHTGGDCINGATPKIDGPLSPWRLMNTNGEPNN